MAKFVETNDGNWINLDYVVEVVEAKEKNHCHRIVTANGNGAYVSHDDWDSAAARDVIVIPAQPGYTVHYLDEELTELGKVVAWRSTHDYPGSVYPITDDHDGIGEWNYGRMAVRRPDGTWFAPDDFAADDRAAVLEIIAERKERRERAALKVVANDQCAEK
jgi:hypothetical protein